MHRRDFLYTMGGGLLSTPWASASAADREKEDTELGAELEVIRKKHNVPALAAARFDAEGKMLHQAAVGWRKAEGKRPVTMADEWHIGSMTKAMTATLLGGYVERGALKWDDTLGAVIPKACRRAHESVKSITVLQLLQHRSGLMANLPDWWKVKANQRGFILELAAPASGGAITPGNFLYSNVGYALAGHLAEELDGKLWEGLLEDKVFKPLRIRAGQGPVGTEGRDDQPWPHDAQGKPLASNGPGSDNAPSLGPAGRVHMSLENYAKFAADHLRGAKGGKALLKPEIYEALHRRPPEGEYACGWGTPERPWAGGRCLTHTGSNNANFFTAWLAPEKAFGVLAACNQGGDAAGKACDEACALMIAGG